MQGQYDFPRFSDPANVVNVRSLANFPPPVGGVITLLADTTYIINTTVNISPNQLRQPANCDIIGISARTSILISNHAISTVDINTLGIVALGTLTIRNTGAGKAVTVDGGATFILTTVVIEKDISVGNFTAVNLDSTLFDDASLTFNTTSSFGGVTLTRSSFQQAVASNSIQVSTGVTIGRLTINNTTFVTVAGGVAVALIDDDTQVVNGAFFQSRFFGGGTRFTNFDETSDAWLMVGNPSFTNSFDQLNVEATAPGTTLAVAANTWTNLSDAGVTITYAIKGTPQKWSLDNVNTGQSTYNGVRPKTQPLSAFLSFEGNGSDLVEFGIGIDGADPVAGNFIAVTTSNTQRGTLTTPVYPISLITGRTVELMFRLNSASSIDFFQAQLVPV